MLTFAIISMTLALLLYTVGVWAVKLQAMLKGWHLLFFFGGFIFDSLGTTAMGELSDGFGLSLHSVTGGIALLLMFVHVVWALFAFVKKDERALKTFYRFNLLVWVFWLVPYLLGLLIAMT